jgi:hypothetical protein
MSFKYSYGDEEIVLFCQLTEDGNLLHNPKFMAKQGEKGKKAIVPGMMNVAYVLSNLPEGAISDSRSQKFYFDDIMNSEQKATLGLINERNYVNFVLDAASNSEKQFMTGSLDGNFEYYPPRDGVKIITPSLDYSIEEFEDIFSFRDPQIAKYALAIAQSSGALLRALPEVADLSDLVQDMKIDKKRGMPRKLPAYTSIELAKESGIPEINPNKPLEYHIQTQKQGKRGLVVLFDCEQESKNIYSAKSNLEVVPFRAIVRMAQDLPDSA